MVPSWTLKSGALAPLNQSSRRCPMIQIQSQSQSQSQTMAAATASQTMAAATASQTMAAATATASQTMAADDSKPDDGGGGDSKPDDGGGDSKPDDGGGDSKPDDGKPAPSKPSTTFGEFRPPKDPVKARKLQDEWAEILQSSIQTAKLRGEGGGKFVQRLENLMESPLDLTTLLERYVCDFCLSDDSTSPDRRYLADWDMCVTGMESERHGTLVFVKDTSGSINQEILESCVSVIQGAMDTLNFDKLVVMDVDTKVCDVQEYYRNDEVPATAKGRGGTDFRPAFTYVEEEVPEARVLIYLTDGYGPFPAEEPDVPTLWITYGIDVDQFPFGQAVDLKNLAL